VCVYALSPPPPLPPQAGPLPGAMSDVFFVAALYFFYRQNELPRPDPVVSTPCPLLPRFPCAGQCSAGQLRARWQFFRTVVARVPCVRGRGPCRHLPVSVLLCCVCLCRGCLSVVLQGGPHAARSSEHTLPSQEGLFAVSLFQMYLFSRPDEILCLDGAVHLPLSCPPPPPSRHPPLRYLPRCRAGLGWAWLANVVTRREGH
jgi:hypothetical protein